MHILLLFSTIKREWTIGDCEEGWKRFLGRISVLHIATSFNLEDIRSGMAVNRRLCLETCSCYVSGLAQENKHLNVYIGYDAATTNLYLLH